MSKTLLVALAAVLVCAPGVRLHAEAPAEASAAVATEKNKADKAGAPSLAHVLKHGDGNGDQKLDLAEIQAKTPKFSQKRFAALDKNQDGLLDVSEFPRAPKKADAGDKDAEKRRAKMREKLKAADTDKDGKLSKAEYVTAFPHAPEERFAAMDRNSDGVVDRRDREAGNGKAGKKKKKAPQKATKTPVDTAKYLTNIVAAHDGDKDGKLTRSELEAAKPGFPDKTFTALDRDNDGALSVADLAPSTN